MRIGWVETLADVYFIGADLGLGSSWKQLIRSTTIHRDGGGRNKLPHIPRWRATVPNATRRVFEDHEGSTFGHVLEAVGYLDSTT